MTGLHKHEPAPAPFLIGHLIDMGESLNTACQDLARDASPDGCDLLIAKLRAAEQGVRQLRRALSEPERGCNRYGGGHE